MKKTTQPPSLDARIDHRRRRLLGFLAVAAGGATAQPWRRTWKGAEPLSLREADFYTEHPLAG